MEATEQDVRDYCKLHGYDYDMLIVVLDGDEQINLYAEVCAVKNGEGFLDEFFSELRYQWRSAMISENLNALYIQKRFRPMKVKITDPGTNSAKCKRLEKAIIKVIDDAYNAVDGDMEYDEDDLFFINPTTFDMGICSPENVPANCHIHKVGEVAMELEDCVTIRPEYVDLILFHYFPEEGETYLTDVDVLPFCGGLTKLLPEVKNK